MPSANCRICNKEIYVKPSHSQRGWGKYCSKVCQNKSQMNGRIEPCVICGKNTYKSQREIKHSKSKKFFCSKSCQTIWRNAHVFTGEAHANWKGGESAYREILLRAERLKVCEMCKTEDMRILSVHHIDEDRKNNELDNLAWLCFNCHFLVHHDIKEHELFVSQRSK